MQQNENIISPTLNPVTFKEARKLIYNEWKKLIKTKNPNPRLLVAYGIAVQALEVQMDIND